MNGGAERRIQIAAKLGCLAILKRVVPKLRRAFPKAEILIRLDAGFTGSDLYDFFEENGLKYVVCMAQNPVLKGLCDPLMEPVREAVARDEVPEPVFGEVHYQARSWSHARRVVMKADMALHPHRKPRRTRVSSSPISVAHRTCLSHRLLCPRRCGKPHQGTQVLPGYRSHQLHQLSGQQMKLS